MTEQSTSDTERWVELGKRSEEYHHWDPRSLYWLIRAALRIVYEDHLQPRTDQDGGSR